MKIIVSPIAVLLLCFAIAQISAIDQALYAASHKACLDENHITEEDLRDSDLKGDDVDMPYKCYLNCIAEKIGFLDKAGKINAEKAKTEYKMNDKSYAKLLACKDQHDMEADPCEYTYKMVQCER